jgi:hypothetical protein
MGIVKIENKNNIIVSTSHRMNIYGASLPPPLLTNGSAGVILQFIVVWNVGSMSPKLPYILERRSTGI